jgi:hypothetical protein
MSVLQPFQFLKFTRDIDNQMRYQEGCGYDLCNVPVIPQGKFVPFGIVSPSNSIGTILLTCHDEVPGVVTFYNIQIQGTFIKNNCPVGYVGTAVTYTVPAGKYNAESQIAADALAVAERDANGQAYANLHGSCISEATYSLIIDEQFDSWTGGLPDNWTIEETDYTTCVDNSDRLDMTISTYPPTPPKMNYPNMQTDTGIDFGAYSQLRINIKVDSITGDHQFVLRYGSTISYIRNLNSGLNEIILIKGFGYDDGWQIIGLKNYTTGQPYPKNIVIDYITIEGLS